MRRRVGQLRAWVGGRLRRRPQGVFEAEFGCTLFKDRSWWAVCRTQALSYLKVGVEEEHVRGSRRPPPVAFSEARARMGKHNFPRQGTQDKAGILERVLL